MSQNYYYLVTGLPDLVTGGVKGFDYAKIRQEIIEELTSEDIVLLKLFLLQFDNVNIINILNKQQGFDSRGWYSKIDLEDAMSDVETLPQYLQTFLQDRKEDKESVAGIGVFEQLSYLYYQEVSAKNQWFADWADFCLDVQNVIAAANARKLGVSTDKSIVLLNDNAEKIAKSRALDFGLGGSLPWIEQITKNLADPIALEEAIDEIYWKRADELSEGKTFGIESVLGFMVKANSIERWLRLNTDNGIARANDLIEKLKSQVQK